MMKDQSFETSAYTKGVEMDWIPDTHNTSTERTKDKLPIITEKVSNPSGQKENTREKNPNERNWYHEPT